MSERIVCESAEALPASDWCRRLRRCVLGWFRTHARDLPWRRTRDPYAIWVSEVMLQQTQVATVRPYFERFVQAFPTVEALAAADEREVLRLWEGLGYYRRARQLHQAARILVAEHGGRFPCQPEVVQRLPGIGRYTAGAILSIAFDARLPVLEANTIRLLSRLLGYRGNPHAAAGQRWLWTVAEAVLPRTHVGMFNQAMMELGSTVCSAKSPRCTACPVAPLCVARTSGLEGQIPLPRPKPPIKPCHEAALLVRRRGRVLLIQHEEGGRWAGLWDFPRVELPPSNHRPVAQHLAAEAARRLGMQIHVADHRGRLRYSITRFRITVDCYDAEYVSAVAQCPANHRLRWVRLADLAEYPLSAPGRRLSRLLESPPTPLQRNRTRHVATARPRPDRTR